MTFLAGCPARPMLLQPFGPKRPPCCLPDRAQLGGLTTHTKSLHGKKALSENENKTMRINGFECVGSAKQLVMSQFQVCVHECFADMALLISKFFMLQPSKSKHN